VSLRVEICSCTEPCRGFAFQCQRSVLQVLHIFSRSGDGDTSLAGLLLDAAGNLYGTTVFGGAHNHGTLFRIASDGEEAIVYSFGAGTDAAWPDMVQCTS